MSFVRAVWSVSAPFIVGFVALFVVLTAASILVKLFNAWTTFLGMS